jgi:hypothetical protein
MSGTTDFPPAGPVTFQQVIKSYLYKQYEDDDDLQGFVAAQNYLAQQWVHDFNNLSLPIWSALSGDLLDWVATGLYGIPRPILSFQQPAPAGGGAGPYNTMPWNALEYDAGKLHPANTNPITYLPVNDDVYQRILTWHLYKGDGPQFSTKWLKRRVHRFLNGSNGYLPVEDNTYDVSITASGVAITITVPATPIGTVLQFAVTDGVLALPFQFTYTVSPTIVILPVDNDAGAVLRGNATFTGYLAIQSHSYAATIGGAAGMSGTLLVLSGTRLLKAEVDAQAGISGDITVLRAAGGVQWNMGGRMNGSGGISGVSSVRGSMGGILAGEAG